METLSKKLRMQSILPAEHPTVDLESYLSNYSGRGRLDRLVFIADCCPLFRVDALQMAAKQIREHTRDTEWYKHVMQRLQQLQSPSLPLSLPLDQAWLEETKRTVQAQTLKLEQELRMYKSNLIKESIRMGHNDLGSHLFACGDLERALQYYSKARDYCTLPKHVLEMCLNVIRVSLALGNFANVSNYVAKAEQVLMSSSNVSAAGAGKGLPASGAESLLDPALVCTLQCCTALVHLESGRYKAVVNSLMLVKFLTGDSANAFPECMSMNDVAIYGGLCALASCDRKELKRLLDNPEFRQYLELEPNIRELLDHFYLARYESCLSILRRIRDDLRLDPYLNHQLDDMYAMIRKRALVQYLLPYQSLELAKMAAVFHVDVAALEHELLPLIRDEKIQARLDGSTKTLHAYQPDTRTSLYAEALEATMVQQNMRLLQLRASLLYADLVIRPEAALKTTKGT